MKSTFGWSLYKKVKEKTREIKDLSYKGKLKAVTETSYGKKEADSKWVLTKPWWDHWEVSQNHQRRETQLQQQNLGCSHLEAAEAVKTDHPRNPFLTKKNNHKLSKQDQSNIPKQEAQNKGKKIKKWDFC